MGNEIEITPKMIEAGYRVLVASGITDAQIEADKLVVAEIFQAMAAAQGSEECHIAPS